MNYRGYKFNLVSQTRSNKIKGAIVHLYNNNNGTYGFIEYGKEFTGYDRIEVSDEVEKVIIITAVDKALTTDELKEKEYTKIKFSFDFLYGIITAINLLNKNVDVEYARSDVS